MAKDDLVAIYASSGVNEEGRGFVTLAAHTADKRVFLGQLSPEEIEAHALGLLQAAEAARQDAAVLRVVRKLELPDQLAGAVITELRDSRGAS